jgi:hypothetical protein
MLRRCSFGIAALHFCYFVGWFLWAPCATHELQTIELMSNTINDCVHRWMKRPDLHSSFQNKNLLLYSSWSASLRSV